MAFKAAGLFALADISTSARRTAYRGKPSPIDILVLCPGLQNQQKVSDINNGEYPATAAMTTGYVFRVENQATVAYLQRVGVTAHLVTVHVSKAEPQSFPLIQPLVEVIMIAMTVACIGFVLARNDWPALCAILALVLASFLNYVLLRRRLRGGWHGAPEPGVHGDLLVLLSQDRWIRMQGLTDDLKRVTSGQWLRDLSVTEGWIEAAAKLLVYLSAILTFDASSAGCIAITALLLSSGALLGLCNNLERDFYMFQRRMWVFRTPQQYSRRLDLAHDLIAETERDDWAIRLGMIKNTEAAGDHKADPVVL